jgi:hypothetical protein
MFRREQATEARYRGFAVMFFFLRIEATSSMLGSGSPVGFLYLIGPGSLSGRGGFDLCFVFFFVLFFALLVMDPRVPV